MLFRNVHNCTTVSYDPCVCGIAAMLGEDLVQLLFLGDPLLQVVVTSRLDQIGGQNVSETREQEKRAAVYFLA